MSVVLLQSESIMWPWLWNKMEQNQSTINSVAIGEQVQRPNKFITLDQQPIICIHIIYQCVIVCPNRLMCCNQSETKEFKWNRGTAAQVKCRLNESHPFSKVRLLWVPLHCSPWMKRISTCFCAASRLFVCFFLTSSPRCKRIPAPTPHTRGFSWGQWGKPLLSPVASPDILI